MRRKRWYPNVPFRLMLGGTKKIHLKIPVRTACMPAEIRTAYLSNTSQKRYWFNHKYIYQISSIKHQFFSVYSRHYISTLFARDHQAFYKWRHKKNYVLNEDGEFSFISVHKRPDKGLKLKPEHVAVKNR